MRTLFLTAFLSCTLLVSKAQNVQKMETDHEDSLAITEVLENRYFKGIYEGDTALLSTVYYGGTLLFGDVKGQPYAKTLEQYLDGVKNRQSPKESGKPFNGEIRGIRIVNSIGIAEVKVKMYDFVYYEFLSFHKIDGHWFLVNKMISDIADQPVSKNSLKASAVNTKVTLVAYINVLPGYEKEIKKALTQMATASRKEPGCEQFVANFRNDAPQMIVIYETYKNDEAFQLHKTSPHAAAFFEFVKGKIADNKIEGVFLTELNGST
jgi:quinol monooxygenase YgiN